MMFYDEYLIGYIDVFCDACVYEAAHNVIRCDETGVDSETLFVIETVCECQMCGNRFDSRLLGDGWQMDMYEEMP